MHRNSASSLALFLRAYLLEQQGRKAPPVLLKQVALSAEEEPGPEEGRVGPLFAEVKNSALVLLQQVALPAEEGPGPEEDRVGPLSAEVENPAQVATASCSAVLDASVGPLAVSFFICNIDKLLTLQRRMLRLHCPL